MDINEAMRWIRTHHQSRGTAPLRVGITAWWHWTILARSFLGNSMADQGTGRGTGSCTDRCSADMARGGAADDCACGCPVTGARAGGSIT